jgi:hypothetical protein
MNIRAFLDTPISHFTSRATWPWKTWLRELGLLLVAYFFLELFAGMFIGLCYDGCCYVADSIVVGGSAFLMLGRTTYIRYICLVVLLFSLVDMWDQKEAKASRQEQALSYEIQDLQKQLQAVRSR